MLPVVMLVASGVMLLASVVLIGLGLRGRLVDDHLHCRRCGFDLFGLPTESTERCSECGARLRDELTHRSVWDHEAVRAGKRERRGGLLAWGVSLALPGVGWLALLAVAMFDSGSAYGFKPEWLLAWETRLGGNVASRAIEELSRRVNVGTLSTQRERALVLRFLDEQADLSAAWVYEKGDFLGYVERAGRLPAADWERYIYQAVSPAMKVRPLVRAEGPVPFAVRSDALRFGTAKGPAFGSGNPGGRWGVIFWVVVEDASGGVETIGVSRIESVSSHVGSSSPGAITVGGALRFQAPLPGPLPPQRIGIWMEEGVGALPPTVRKLPAWPAHVVPVAVAPPGQPTTLAIDDEDMREAVEATLRLRLTDPMPFRRGSTTRPTPEHAIKVRFRGRSDGMKTEELYVHLVRDASRAWPLAGAWSMTVRVAGQDLDAGTIAVPFGASSHGFGQMLLPPDGEATFPADVVDVILTPDQDAAERSIGITEYWNGTIEIKDVPLIRPEPRPVDE